MEREKKIIRTSVIGIAANLLLAAFKAGVGVFARSIAIVMDAVNNLSDALSSLITIIGTKLAAKAPDRDHPLGHGRAEYLSAMVIALIIIYAGVTSMVESVRKIIRPQIPEYTAVSLVIVAVAVLVKIFLGRYVERTGRRVRSDSLIASGRDAVMDSVISASTLLAAGIFIFTGISLEAWLGAAISLFIIKTGLDVLRNTINDILGARADAELARGIKETVNSFPDVKGTYDLILSSYGPSKTIGSLHIQVPDEMRAPDLDRLERDIQLAVLKEHQVILTGISVYSSNIENPLADDMRHKVMMLCGGYKEILELHGFYVDDIRKEVRFDIVVDFDCDRGGIRDEVERKSEQMFPEYTVHVVLDADTSD